MIRLLFSCFSHQGVVLTVPAQTASTPSQVGQKAVEPSQAETVRLSGVYRCAFDVGEPMTLRVFVSDFEKHEQGKHNERLVYENENLKYVGNMEALSKEVGCCLCLLFFHTHGV